MKHRHLIAALTAAALLAPAAAWAGDDALRGTAYVRALSKQHDAVVLGDTVYHLGAHTQVTGFDGERVSLADLDGVPEVESLEQRTPLPTLLVEFDATRVGDRLILNWLQLSLAQEGIDPVARQQWLERHGKLRGRR